MTYAAGKEEPRKGEAPVAARADSGLTGGRLLLPLSRQARGEKAQLGGESNRGIFPGHPRPSPARTGLDADSDGLRGQSRQSGHGGLLAVGASRQEGEGSGGWGGKYCRWVKATAWAPKHPRTLPFFPLFLSCSHKIAQIAQIAHGHPRKPGLSLTQRLYFFFACPCR